jgi:tetratricopeptide (TPR) repeat protein
METLPSEDAVRSYLELGLEHAAPRGEARVRLLIARTMWPFAFRRSGFTDDEADAARHAGEEAVELALGQGRRDLASAALDGLGSIEFIRGRHGVDWHVVERRLAIVDQLTDPWEVGDALQTAADVSLAIGRYRDALRFADEGYERSRSGPDVWRACLAWRAVARFQLGDWEGMIEDVELLEAARATTRFGTAGYFTIAARSCAALLYELRGELAAADRLYALAVEYSPGTATSRRIPWLARLAAHRGEAEEAFDWLAEGDRVDGAISRSAILEAACEVVADLGRWGLAETTVAEARAFAELAQVEALLLHADRLEGRTALADGDHSAAESALARASHGFAALGARWEEAVSTLWLAEAFRAAGDRAAAQRSAEAALGVFDELRSVRELQHARSLLADL